jgi:DNA-binding XRE family transcriptional regulator
MVQFYRAKLVEARQRAGLSQAQVANWIGVTPHFVLQVEYGHRDASYRTMVKWIEALGEHAEESSIDLFRQMTPKGSPFRTSQVLHGHASGGKRSPEYLAWLGIRQNRAARVCERWASFTDFLADVGPRPSPDHRLERIDPLEEYGPSNCRWRERTKAETAEVA